MNILWIGQVVNWLVQLIPPAQDPIAGVLMMLASILVLGFATAFYLSANLGAGPRDGMMLGVRRRTGWSVRRSRTAIEGVVLIAGWLLGGQVGIGTVIVALCIGPAIQFMLRLLERIIPMDTPGVNAKIALRRRLNLFLLLIVRSYTCKTGQSSCPQLISHTA